MPETRKTFKLRGHADAAYELAASVSWNLVKWGPPKLAERAAEAGRLLARAAEILERYEEECEAGEEGGK